MKHEHGYLRPRDLPTCSLSVQCLRFIDDLDPRGAARQRYELAIADGIDDEQLLEQLRVHVPTCPTCTVILVQARRVRRQQRAALRDLLADSEREVPSMTTQILAAIRREQRE